MQPEQLLSARTGCIPTQRIAEERALVTVASRAGCNGTTLEKKPRRRRGLFFSSPYSAADSRRVIPSGAAVGARVGTAMTVVAAAGAVGCATPAGALAACSARAAI